MNRIQPTKSLHQCESIDEDICCICMDSKSNTILACTHSYCENCIREWQVINRQCPVCRCKSGEKDAFILADKPDYFLIQEEMSNSLFGLTQSPHATAGKTLVDTTADTDDSNSE